MVANTDQTKSNSKVAVNTQHRKPPTPTHCDYYYPKIPKNY
ncbi:uncharacterized protein G2W53_041183 [Senna tora]|uniref:Uncharacterized protein n=1 Tax=Senna tora TaxID=362788 RepID=A0A834VYI1_9FABA|nr:uncharacterized protein G2W53_041183 [Senna tora]